MISTRSRSRPDITTRFVLASTVLLYCCGTALAQLPRTRLFAIDPAGGQQGTAVDVKIASGADLDDVTRLIFSHPGLSLEPAGDANESEQPKPPDGVFRVKIGDDVPPGRYEVRALGRFGVSNPRSFFVSDQAEAAEKEPNNSRGEAQTVSSGTIVNGRCQGGQDVDFYAIDMKADQRVLVECWAERIESRMDATLVLYDEKGNELTNSRDRKGRDPAIDFSAPADGRYFFKVHDFLYAEGNEYVYRLYVGSAPRIDYVFPPAGEPGRVRSLTLFGRNLPGGKPVDGLAVNGVTLEKLHVDVPLERDSSRRSGVAGTQHLQMRNTSFDVVPYRVSSPRGVSNAVPIGLAHAPVAVEHEPNDDPQHAQHIVLPCEFVGQFQARGDRDWITFDAVKDETYWLEVYSQRHGLTSDPYVRLQRVEQDGSGGERVSNITELDDSGRGELSKSLGIATEDPVYQFKVPQSGTYRVMIRDLYADSRGSPHLIYRLAIRRPRPGYQLVALAELERAKKDSGYEPAAPLLRRGGSMAVSVNAIRADGFDGPVELSVEGLPESVTCQPAVLGPGQETTALVLRASDEAATWCGPITIVGKAEIDGREEIRRAFPASVVWGVGSNQGPPPSRITSDLLLAVSDQEQTSCVVQFGAIPQLKTVRSEKVNVPVKIERRDGGAHPVTLSAYSLPAEVQGKEITIAGDKTEGTLELEVNDKAPLGEFTVALLARTQRDYRRNQAAVDEANRARDAAKQQAEQSAAAAESAAAKQKELETTRAETAQRIEALSESLARAETAYPGALAHAEAMSALLAAVGGASQASPDDRPLSTALKFAHATAEAAEQNRQSSEAALTSARQSLDDVRSILQTTDAQLAAATTAAKEAAARRAAAEESLQAAENRAKEVNEANKPEKKDVALASNSIRLLITEASQKSQ